MIIYPAIDLKNQQCIRLYQGDFAKPTIYKNDPISVAKSYADSGAEFIHIIDLDGAQAGLPKQSTFITELQQSCGLKVQSGGGIREKQHVEQLLSQGIERVIIGSLAVKQPKLIQQWLQEFGSEHIVLALDIRHDELGVPMIATHGWQSTSNVSLWDFLEDFESSHLKHILCTDIDCDGTLQGPNISLYTNCVQRFPRIKIQASGGIGNIDHVKQLKSHNISGAIIGKALYENKFSLDEALSC